jgi:hypothetical protein
VLRKPDNEMLRKKIRGEVKELCARFPVYTDMARGCCS